MKYPGGNSKYKSRAKSIHSQLPVNYQAAYHTQSPKDHRIPSPPVMYRGMPLFQPPLGPSQRRREARRVETEPWPPTHHDWMNTTNWSLVPPFATYVPAPFYPRHLEAVRSGPPVMDVGPPPALDVAAGSREPTGFPLRGSGVDESKYSSGEQSAAMPTVPLSASSTVESAFRELHHQLAMAFTTFEGYFSRWNEDKAKIPYAERETLESLWQNMLQDRMRGKVDDEKRFHGAGDKILRCVQQARAAADSLSFMDMPADIYLVDRRKRIVTRVELSCEAIAELTRKAAHDPVA